MPIHEVRIDHLEASHERRLRWFQINEGAITPFPPPVSGAGHLATRAKGIYKPAGFDYALSIRSMMSSPYADKPLEEFADGSWSIRYFQENPDVTELKREYTNRALMRCIQDAVPVGVLLQVEAQPTRYVVQGLAKVSEWTSGYFLLEAAETA